MPKPDNNRDYYGDLGLPPSADEQEIKKQFRKLALQYHPDRNPGREAEVNSKFQLIQSAHEILSDPELKSKYDVGRRSRFPGASGVKGNPWSDVGKNFPAPPRRAGQDRPSRNPPPSGAHKYRNFTSGAAPTAKQPQRDDPMEARRNAWQAFEHMRPGAQGKSAASQANRRPVPPRPTEPDTEPAPRPVPRTPGQRQRAEAAFGGGRKTGYEPHSPVPGDEPPVSSSGYSTNRHTFDAASATPSEPIPDPLAQFRETRVDPRHRSPYSGGSGEKVDPFDGAPLGRAKSTRESARNDQSGSDHLSPGGTRHRSSSAPRSGTPNEGSSSQQGSPTTANFPQRKPFVSRASARYTPAGVTPSNSGPGTPTGVNGASQAYAPGDSSKPNGPTMYDNSNSFQRSSSSSFLKYYAAKGSVQFCKYPYGQGTSRVTSRKISFDSSPTKGSPSGDNVPHHNLSPYELQQGEILKDLISNAYSLPVQERKRHLGRANPADLSQCADTDATNSFTFPVDEETFKPSSPSPTRFTKSSVEEINTRFVNGQGSDAWKFTAGSPTSEDPHQKRRAQSGSLLGRDSPQGPPPRPPKEPADHQHAPAASDAKWDAQGWAGIGAQNFVPQPAQAPSVSPTRQPTRTNSRKPRVKQTAGTAGIVNEDSSSDEPRDAAAPRPNVETSHTDSPSAMDIDSPPHAPPTYPPQPPQQPSTARNIPVEPSRPEWRPGNAQSVPESAMPQQAAQKATFNPNAAGSEDTDEFRASFADLRNVAPFAPQASGLNSFGDLKSNLPFESRASHRPPPHEKRKQPPPLEFPTVPRAPSPPAALAISHLKPSTSTWQKYLQEFQEYMQRWDAFSCAVTDHFAARKQLILSSRGAHGYSFLTSQGTDGIQEYLEWVQQDKEIRHKWTVACDEHEQRVKDFLVHRVQMSR